MLRQYFSELGVDAGEEGEKFASFVEVILSRWLQWFYTNVICPTPVCSPGGLQVIMPLALQAFVP